MRVRFPLALLALTILAGMQPAAASDRVGPIEVIQLSQSAVSFQFGYIEHRMQLRNLSPQTVHSVDVIMPATSYTRRGAGIRRISRTVVLHPGDTAEVSLPQPARRIMGDNNAQIVVRGVISEAVHVPSRQTSTPNQNAVSVFVSRAVNSDHLQQALTLVLDPGAATAPAPGGRPAYRGLTPVAALTRAESEIAAWSPNWLAYSSFAGVVLSAGEWRAASASVREALFRYAACGGVVIFMGELAPPNRWLLDQREIPGGMAWSIGIGQMYSMAADNPDAWDAPIREEIVKQLRRSTARWSTDFTSGEAHRIYPVITELSIPVAGYFYLLLGFAALAGPGLLFLLARMNRKIWLLWAAPSLSTVACGIVLVYALYADGITPTRRADTLVFLDQLRHEGSVIGLTGYFAPLTPAGGVRFSAETALASFEKRSSHHHLQNRLAWRMDFTLGQHLASGLIQARVPEVLQIRKPFNARERLDIQTGADGSINALNGLGADIHLLRVRATDGRWFEGGPLGAGRRVDLTPITQQNGARVKSVAVAVSDVTATSGWAAGLRALKVEDLDLASGTYAAELAHCPFLEHGIDGRLNNTERSIIIGRYAAEP